MCLHPLYIKGHRIPCGKCVECVEKRARDWSFRAEQECSASPLSLFLTLTYNEEHLPIIEGIPVLKPLDLQLFFKRFRKQLDLLNVKLRYYAIGEYGPTTRRPHYHCLLHFSESVDYWSIRLLIAECWNFGFITCDICNIARIRYCVGYMCPINELSDFYRRHPPFSRMSRSYGKQYLTPSRITYYKQLENDSIGAPIVPWCYLSNKYKMALPRYYRNRIYCASEKAALKYSFKDDIKRKEEDVYGKMLDANKQLIRDYERENKIDLNRLLHQLVWMDNRPSDSEIERRRQKLIKKRKL